MTMAFETRVSYRREALQRMAIGIGEVTSLSVLGRRLTFAQQESGSGVPRTGETSPQLRPLDELMASFVKQHDVPGASLAVMKGAKLVYARGFGLADTETKRGVQPNSLFRIASVSKPLTAVAILQLWQKKKLRLEDRVFDILPAQEWLPEQHDPRLKEITVRQLLQHTGGWDRDKSFDPIVNAREAVRVLGKSLPASAEDIARYTLTLPLDFDPGKRYAYSNVGYLLLGRIIQQTSSQTYEAFVKQNVLAPIKVSRMSLGRASESSLDINEVRYLDRKHRVIPAVNGGKIGTDVPLVYGGENIEGYEAHGGWIASAADLVKFAAALTGAAKPVLLKPPALKELVSRPSGAAGHKPDGTPMPVYYGLGFNVRPIGREDRFNVWHDGLIAGTSSLLVLRHDGFCWAVLFNTDRSPDDKVLSGLIDPLIHQAIDSVNW